VGLTEGRLLTHDRDLDNYLYPVLNRLGHARFAAAFGSKRRQDHSTIAVGPTTPIAPRRSPDLVVSPTGTYEKREWILQIERACAHASPLDPYGNGPIRLVIAYDLGPSRNWTSLWKPTIDGLEPLLGTVIRPKKIHDDPGMAESRTWSSTKLWIPVGDTTCTSTSGGTSPPVAQRRPRCEAAAVPFRSPSALSSIP
jgi:hypothetical protein